MKSIKLLKKSQNNEATIYGNWMPKRFLYIGISLSVISISIITLFSIFWLDVLFTILGLICVPNAIYALYAYHTFDPKGGDLQNKAHDLLIQQLPWNGNGVCLDIGCGSAALSIKLAKKYPRSKIIASDYWGKTVFEYSERQCVKNAQIEGVADRIEFRFADANHLPFADETLDAVVSNLTFHEVIAMKKHDRYAPLLEALRVLKKGGVFAFQDLFASKLIFGNLSNLKTFLANNVDEVQWLDSFTTLNVPRCLNTVMMLQGMSLFFGKK